MLLDLLLANALHPAPEAEDCRHENSFLLRELQHAVHFHHLEVPLGFFGGQLPIVLDAVIEPFGQLILDRRRYGRFLGRLLFGVTFFEWQVDCEWVRIL